MSGDDSEPSMSIAERIAALNNRCGGAVTTPTPAPSLASAKPKAKSDALASRIAALEQNNNAATSMSNKIGTPERPKVGKLKPQDGAPMIPFRSGPPPSLLRKQKEREERIEKLQQEAKSIDTQSVNTEENKSNSRKISMPSGAVPIMAFGAGPPPPLLLKKQREREALMEKLREEAQMDADEEAEF